jgi:hypothetical protein
MKAVVLWSCALVAAASLLIAVDYRSRDPDSALYARLSGELATLPPSQWIAPDWGGAWNLHGRFREHPVGILLVPVLLITAGFPPDQAPYVVNMLYQVAVVLLIPVVAGVMVKGLEARALAWVLQLLPVAFVYRIRANQEHPLLMGLLALLYGTHRARTRSSWLILMIASCCFLVLIKGAFAMFALIAAALWLLLIPTPEGGSNRWAWTGLGLAVVAAAVMVAGYEALYVHTTGESFLAFYGSKRLGDSMRLGDAGILFHILVNVGWYLTRLAWFTAPWSVFAVAAVWSWMRWRTPVGRIAPLVSDAPPFSDATERALLWAMLLTAVYIAVLSPALVRAERFIFPTYFVIGAAGVVTAIRNVDAVRRFATRSDQYMWLPIAVWMVTLLLSLASRTARF